MNYNVTPCILCNKAMTLAEVREGVYWHPWTNWPDWILRGIDQPEFELAHRRCWKSLREKQRDSIRRNCLKGHSPRTMGALA